jgi:hypothetical protein
MAEIQGEGIKFFSQHLVLLELTYTLHNQGKAPAAHSVLFSGFVLDLGGYWIWVSAGHVQADIEDLLGYEQAKDPRFRLIDTLHGRSITDHPVIFDYLGAPKGRYLREGQGWDYGLVFLHHFYVRQLAKNHIRPVDHMNWQGRPEEFDEYYLLGLPNERVSRTPSGNLSVIPTMISLTRLDEKPEYYRYHTLPMFYATIDPGNAFQSIVGMSGGPILGVKKLPDGRGNYFFLAIQSGWDKNGIICASFLDHLASVAAQAIDDALGEVASKEEYRSESHPA